jgi:hypothetical protein
MIIGVYADDIVIAGKSEKQAEEFKQAVDERIDVKDLGTGQAALFPWDTDCP